MKTLFITFISFALLFSFSSCDNASSLIQNGSSAGLNTSISQSQACPDSMSTTIDDLTQDDIANLLLMCEEEKMAKDVYSYFYNIYGTSIFYNIENSEDRHENAVSSLILYYGFSDPTSSQDGIFNNTTLQNLYDTLIVMGSDSIQAALRVGALIEETDINDLQNILDSTNNVDIERVYTNLLNGSYNHLRSFVSRLSIYGITYVPQILSQEHYETILTSSNENGNGNRNSGGSNGSGYRYGQGG